MATSRAARADRKTPSFRRFLRNNGLSLVLLLFFLGTFAGGQVLTGWHVHNEERWRNGRESLSLSGYLVSPHFLEATAENWESEFFQMYVFVVITVFLYQKGSAESRDPDAPERPAPVTKRSPWPVRRGGFWLRIYRHSLSLALVSLFLFSFLLHLWSGTALENEDRVLHGETPLSLLDNLGQAQFWFQSFQNWQSEFLSILAMVVLTIFLRERHSPESKAVEAPHDATGE